MKALLIIFFPLIVLFICVSCKNDSIPRYHPVGISNVPRDSVAVEVSADTNAVRIIFNQIITKLNIRPRLVFTTDTEEGTHTNRGTVYMTLADIERCKRLGSQFRLAIAILAGHECHHFIRGISGAYSGTCAKNCDNQDEREADIFGVFCAYLYQGYPVLENTPKVFEVLCQANLYDKCHPGLTDRQHSATVVSDLVEQYIQIYDQACYTFFLPYDETMVQAALKAFEFLNNQLPNLSEIQNNLSVAYILMALNAPGYDNPYAFPLELDFAFRLKSEGPKGSSILSGKQLNYLAKADSLNKLVLKKSPGHRQASINSYCIKLISGDSIAENDLIKLKKDPAFGLLYGIWLSQQGWQTKATLEFDKVIKNPHTALHLQRLAAINLAKITKTEYHDSDPSFSYDGIKKETLDIDNEKLSDYVFNGPKGEYKYQSLDENKNFRIGHYAFSGNKIFVLRQRLRTISQEKLLQIKYVKYRNKQFLVRLYGREPVELIFIRTEY